MWLQPYKDLPKCLCLAAKTKYMEMAVCLSNAQGVRGIKQQNLHYNLSALLSLAPTHQK